MAARRRFGSRSPSSGQLHKIPLSVMKLRKSADAIRSCGLQV
jgi:hypothetical protein